MSSTDAPHRTQRLGLGLDAGGTATRWALADAGGRLLAEGRVAGLTGLLLADATGRAAVAARLAEIAAAVRAHQPGGQPVGALIAGLTGFDGDQAPLFAALASQALGVPAAAVQTLNDIELVCHNSFAPGEGIVVYGGTGSVAAFLDAQGRLQRAGGRGVVIDDAGGGHWIAREALRLVWRGEDEQPGAWQGSALARAVFGHIGGSGWAVTRDWVYGAGPGQGPDRGRLGLLALAVAEAAHRQQDAAALDILRRAGAELARLARALQRRCGATLPLSLAGRVFELHPVVEQALRDALPAAAAAGVRRLTEPAHQAAARRAAKRAALPAEP